MKYAVYILGPADKSKKKDLMKDKSEGAMLKGALAGAAADVLGVEFYDPIAKSLTDGKSVAISGKTITRMEYNTNLIFGTRYQIARNGDGAETGRTDVYSKTLKHVLTVKGVLEANNAMFGIASLKDLLKKKDLSRVWTWANTHFDAEEKDYYRDVVAISYSTEQDRYRALVIEKAFVDRYEEHFDKDGIGHFTLAIAKVIDSSMNPAADVNNTGIKLAGPTFDFNLTQLVNSYSTASSAAKKAADKGIEIAGKFGADTETAKKVSKSLQKVYDIGGGVVNNGKIDLTSTSIAKQIERGVDMSKIIKDEANKTTETDIERTETKNDDGTITVTETTKNPDGSKIIKKTTKDAKGNVTKVETDKVKA